MGAHALRGEVRVQFFGDDPDNLACAPWVWLGASRADPDAERYEVLSTGSGRGGELRLALKGVADRDAAEALRGRLVLGDPDHLNPLEEGEFYWHQLVGCEVRGTDGSLVGRVREIWETGAHDLLVVDGGDGSQLLFSTARELMPVVDLEARRVVVELLPGMLDPDGEG
jgi:16S rRNA processing protein RimM